MDPLSVTRRTTSGIEPMDSPSFNTAYVSAAYYTLSLIFASTIAADVLVLPLSKRGWLNIITPKDLQPWISKFHNLVGFLEHR